MSRKMRTVRLRTQAWTFETEGFAEPCCYTVKIPKGRTRGQQKGAAAWYGRHAVEPRRGKLTSHRNDNKPLLHNGRKPR